MVVTVIIAAIVGAFGVWSGASILLEGCARITFDGSRIGGRSFLIQPVCVSDPLPGVTTLPGTLIGVGFLVLGVLLLIPLLGVVLANLPSGSQESGSVTPTHVRTAEKLILDEDLDDISRVYIVAARSALDDSRGSHLALADIHVSARREVLSTKKRALGKLSQEEQISLERKWLEYLSEMSSVPVRSITERLNESTKARLGISP